jgi:hypothetical protein
MKGHAAKAKHLLDEAYGEIKQAAEAANRRWTSRDVRIISLH